MAQDAFLIAYRKWDEFDSVDNPGAWLRVIARNLVLNETAKLNRRQRLINENLTTILADAADEEIPAEELIDISVRREALMDCMQYLTDRARAVVVCRYYQDEKSCEIGRKFEMKPAAVRKLLFHARQTLAGCIRDKLADARP